MSQSLTPRCMWLVGAVALSACATPAAQAPAPQRAVSPAPNQQTAPAVTHLLSSDVPRMPRAVTSFGAVAHDGGVFVFGGYFGVPHDYSREGQSGELSRLDLASGTWQSLAAGEGVQGAQLVATNRGVLRVGGMRAENGHDQPERVVSLADVALWNEARATWDTLPSLPVARSSHAAVTTGDKMFIVGGWTLTGDRSHGSFSDQMLVLDLETKTYSALAQPFQARALGAGVVDGKVVVVGGMDAQAKPTRAVHVFDPSSQLWSRGPDYPEDAFGIATTSNGKALFASARDGLLRRLDLAQGVWTSVEALAFPRFFHQLAMVDDRRVAVLGGISGMHHSARVSHVEVLDTEDPAPRVLNFTLRNPSRAKNRQGVQLVGESLLVFGGNRSLAQHDFEPDDFVADAFGLDLGAMQFEPLPSFPTPRQTIQTAALDGSLLALGGFGHDGEKARAHAEAYTFDAKERTWRASTTRLPTPRTQFGLARFGEELWVFGGLDYDPTRGNGREFVHPVEVMKARVGQGFGTTKVALPSPRRAFGGAVLDQRYYMVGGMADGFAPVTGCDVFDFTSEAWSSIPCPVPRISPQLVALDGKLYLAGGSIAASGGELSPAPALEVFDPATQTWSTLLPQLPVEPRHLAMVALKHALLLYSAHQEDETVKVSLVVP